MLKIGITKIYERKLQMADKSKNEQYDIVSQAEDVLRDYIKRYFDIEQSKKHLKRKTPQKRKRNVFFAFMCMIVLGAAVAVIWIM